MTESLLGVDLKSVGADGLPVVTADLREPVDTHSLSIHTGAMRLLAGEGVIAPDEGEYFSACLRVSAESRSRSVS